MTLGTRQIVYGTHYLDIKADNISSMSVSNQKLLGLYIDAKLNYNTYIDNLCKVVSSETSLRQLSEYVPLNVQNNSI